MGAAVLASRRGRPKGCSLDAHGLAAVDARGNARTRGMTAAPGRVTARGAQNSAYDLL